MSVFLKLIGPRSFSDGTQWCIVLKNCLFTGDLQEVFLKYSDYVIKL